MPEPRDIDGVLVQWGDRLFYPGNRRVKPSPEPRLTGFGWCRAALIRERELALKRQIDACCPPRPPQPACQPKECPDPGRFDGGVILRRTDGESDYVQAS